MAQTKDQQIASLQNSVRVVASQVEAYSKSRVKWRFAALCLAGVLAWKWKKVWR